LLQVLYVKPAAMIMGCQWLAYSKGKMGKKIGKMGKMGNKKVT